MIDMSLIKAQDPEIYEALSLELGRQRDNIELIASENFVSPAVMAAAGSFLTNKYAEGYPGKRYYGGCQFVDIAENLARDRAKQLFGCDHVNVQPHSGANANLAVYFAVCKPGDTILGMNLSHGGHLSHGSPVNISGKYFNIVPYGVSKETETIDYDELERSPSSTSPGSSWRALRRTRAPLTLRVFGRLRTRSARFSWWTSRTSRVSSLQDCTRIRFRMRNLSPRPRTRPFADPAAA